MTQATIDNRLLEKAVESLPRDGLAPARREALSRFREMGFPTTRQEDWKYTNLAPAADLSNLWLRDALAEPFEPITTESARERAESLATQIDAHWLVIANGVIEAESLAALASLGIAGLEVSSAAQGAGFGRVAAGDPMTLFNAALLRDALYIRVAPGTDPGKPLAVLVFDDAGAALSQPCFVIETGDNARVQIIEVHASAGENDQFANAVTEVDLARGSRVDFVRIQQRQRGHYQVGKLGVRAARDSTFNHAGFDLGGGLIRNDVAVDIAEPGAAICLNGLYLADGKQHIDNHTRVDHRVGPATSTEEYRGILNGRARAVFNGKAIVHRGADGTDAHQANHNLLLSDKAEVDTKPELEIYADDVKCSHGATVGQLDEAALFYLRTRGLDREEAAHALTRAFAAEIVAGSPVAEARDYLERAIETRLQELTGQAL